MNKENLDLLVAIFATIGIWATVWFIATGLIEFIFDVRSYKRIKKEMEEFRRKNNINKTN